MSSSCSQALDLVLVNGYGQEVIVTEEFNRINCHIPAGTAVDLEFGFGPMLSTPSEYVVKDAKGAILQVRKVSKDDERMYYVDGKTYMLVFGPGPAAPQHMPYPTWHGAAKAPR